MWLSQDRFSPGGAWSRILRHSAWRRVRAPGASLAAAGDGGAKMGFDLGKLRRSCWEFAARMGYTLELQCLDPARDDTIRRITQEAHAGMSDRELESVLLQTTAKHQ